ncbi:translin-associated factor X-interacting protein 1 isoform X3 [Scleropages formosus]|uniref:translin-associated factor X-interacting protein 1 isoform X3 n=1 Tax=Scleropages formosus TaxID=113540 RepID=UPI0010FA6F47|nr:uncharacterized protein LOC108918974 isoform X3 [Scleropages formosus]
MVKVALEVCGEDLIKAQVELNHLQAEYRDAVPCRVWEALDHAYQETLLKLQTLQMDFDQIKAEYDTLLEVHIQITEQWDILEGELKAFQGTFTSCPHWTGKTAQTYSGHISQGQSSLTILLQKLEERAMKQEFFIGLVATPPRTHRLTCSIGLHSHAHHTPSLLSIIIHTQSASAL